MVRRGGGAGALYLLQSHVSNWSEHKVSGALTAVSLFIRRMTPTILRIDPAGGFEMDRGGGLDVGVSRADVNSNRDHWNQPLI